MADNLTKIATCSYCGARSVLRLADLGSHHELTCPSCAAPIHEMKFLKRSAVAPAPVQKTIVPTEVRIAHPTKLKKKSKKKKSKDEKSKDYYKSYDRPKKRKKSKKRRGLSFSKIVEEAFDFLEDILD